MDDISKEKQAWIARSYRSRGAYLGRDHDYKEPCPECGIWWGKHNDTKCPTHFAGFFTKEEIASRVIVWKLTGIYDEPKNMAKTLLSSDKRAKFFGSPGIPRVSNIKPRPAFAPVGFTEWNARSYDRWENSVPLRQFFPGELGVERRCEKSQVKYRLWAGHRKFAWQSAEQLQVTLMAFVLTGELPEEGD